MTCSSLRAMVWKLRGMETGRWKSGSFEKKVKNHVIWDVVLKLNHPKEDLTNYVDVMLI